MNLCIKVLLCEWCACHLLSLGWQSPPGSWQPAGCGTGAAWTCCRAGGSAPDPLGSHSDPLQFCLLHLWGNGPLDRGTDNSQNGSGRSPNLPAFVQYQSWRKQRTQVLTKEYVCILCVCELRGIPMKFLFVLWRLRKLYHFSLFCMGG